MLQRTRTRTRVSVFLFHSIRQQVTKLANKKGERKKPASIGGKRVTFLERHKWLIPVVLEAVITFLFMLYSVFIYMFFYLFTGISIQGLVLARQVLGH